MRTIFNIVAAAFLFFVTPNASEAQTYTTASKFMWSAPSNAMDIADAQAGIYKIYLNNNPNGVTLTGVVCGPPQQNDVIATCEAFVPATMLPTLNKRKAAATITITDPDSSVESDKSAPFLKNEKFNMIQNFRLVP